MLCYNDFWFRCALCHLIGSKMKPVTRPLGPHTSARLNYKSDAPGLGGHSI